MALTIPSGIDGIPTASIPSDPADFVNWFKSVGIKRWLANADIRNAASGTGISITGTLATPATVSVSSEIAALFAQPYVLVGAPVAPAPLTDYRSIAAQSGVLSLTDAGAESTITVGVAVNGIGNVQIRQGAALSVIGNASNALANVADIAATATGQLLMNGSGGLVWTEALAGTYSIAGSLAITAGTGAESLVVTGAANQDAIVLQGSSTGGESYGLSIQAGTTTADTSLYVANAAGTTVYLKVVGDGGLVVGAPTGGSQSVGTVNATAYYVNGTALVAPTSANPSASIGLSAVDGTSAHFMTADSAPALSQGIVPTWSGKHTFTPGSGTGLNVNGIANADAAIISGSSTAGESYGLSINAGTTSADNALYVENQAGTEKFLVLYGDGHGVLGYNGSANTITFSAAGAVVVTGSLQLATSTDVGFYGTTPVAQRASTSIQRTSNLSTLTTSASWGTADAAAFNQAVASLREVMNTLEAYGLWSIS